VGFFLGKKNLFTMLHFLRKIRRSLINSGSMRKYTLYAIGEIALVVIGILIALSINNWNERSKDRVKEKMLLLKFEKTLESNCILLNGYINRMKRGNNSTNIVLSSISNNSEYSDTLDNHFHSSRVLIPLKFISYSGYEEFKNLGFEIIDDDSLKNSIIKLYETVYPKMQEILDQFGGEFSSGLDEFVRNNFIGNNLENKDVPINYSKLINNNYYKYSLDEYQGVRQWLIEQYENSLDESESLLSFIKQKLKNK
jgi:hypothetical protein